MGETRRDRVVAYFDGQAVDPPVIPLIGKLAASINQLPVEVFYRNTTQRTNALERAFRLFDHDAVVTSLESTLLTDALGATVEWQREAEEYVVTETPSGTDEFLDAGEAIEAGRVPGVVESADRLVQTLGDEVPVFGGIPGPLVTQHGLTGEITPGVAAEPVRVTIGELARAYGRVGVDGFLLHDRAPIDATAEAVRETLISGLELLANIATFFDVPLLVAPIAVSPEDVGKIVGAAPVDGVFVDTDSPAEAADRIGDVRVGGGITPALLTESAEAVERTLTDRFRSLDAPVFPATGVEVPTSVHPDKLHAVRRAVRGGE